MFSYHFTLTARKAPLFACAQQMYPLGPHLPAHPTVWRNPAMHGSGKGARGGGQAPVADGCGQGQGGRGRRGGA